MLRDAYRPRNLSLRYDKLLWKAQEEYRAQIFVSNDLEPVPSFTLVVTVYDDEGRIAYEQTATASAGENTSGQIGEITLTVPPCRGMWIELYSPELRITSRYFMAVENEQGKIDRQAVRAFVADYLSHKAQTPED